MGRIYYMMGKSSSGKDSLFKMLLEDEELSLKTIVPYTTRPMRAGETDGVEYVFCGEERLRALQEAGRVIELRSYDTVCGVWKYFTVDDAQIDLNIHDYLMIGTLESYLKIKKYYGKEKVVPIYIEVEDGIRLQRALNREKTQKTPNYEEICRRFLADAEDFSEERIRSAGIGKRFVNCALKETEQNIKHYMLE